MSRHSSAPCSGVAGGFEAPSALLEKVQALEAANERLERALLDANRARLAAPVAPRAPTTLDDRQERQRLQVNTRW